MAISELSGKPPKVLGGGIFEELVPIQVEVKSVLKPELNMPVSIALSDKEYHHSPCMECQFIPRLPSGTSSGFPDNFPVLLDGENTVSIQHNDPARPRTQTSRPGV